MEEALERFKKYSGSISIFFCNDNINFEPINITEETLTFEIKRKFYLLDICNYKTLKKRLQNGYYNNEFKDGGQLILCKDEEFEQVVEYFTKGIKPQYQEIVNNIIPNTEKELKNYIENKNGK